MKVLMLGWEYPPKISGGLGIACHAIANSLVKKGISVDFVLPKLDTKALKSTAKGLSLLDANNYPTKKTEIRKVLQEITHEIKYLEVGTRLMPYLTHEEFERIAYQTTTVEHEVTEEVILEKITLSGGYGEDLFQETVKYAVAILNVVEAQSYDVIHAHDWMTFEAGIMAREASGKPLVMHVHSTEYDRTAFRPNPAIFEIEKRGLQKADSIITVSKRTKNILTEHYDVPAAKITIVYNAIQQTTNRTIDFKRNVAGAKKVLFAGRLTAQKGPERFLDLAIELHRKFPDVTFTIAGDGYLRETLEAKVEANNLAKHVKFTGFVNHKKMQKLMAAHDLALLPSFSEPFGLVALELASCGTPVIVSEESGVAERLKSLKRIARWDTYHWVEAAENLLSNTAKSMEYAKKLTTDVAKLHWKDAAQEIKQIYLKLK